MDPPKCDENEEDNSFEEWLERVSQILDEPDYHPVKDFPFPTETSIPFSFLANALDRVAACSGSGSKEKKIIIMGNVFRSFMMLAPETMPALYYFCCCRIGPQYLQKDLGIGNEILVKAIAQWSGRSGPKIKKHYNKVGDLGQVAMESKATQKTMFSFFKKKVEKVKVLTFDKVFETIHSIPEQTGKNSSQVKINLIFSLFNIADGASVKYIVRFLQKNLKIQCAEASMQASLARAFALTTPGGEVMNY